MPAQDQKTQPFEMPTAFRQLFDAKLEPDLAHEISELRREIAALRNELAPVPTLIITGRAVLDEFKRMSSDV